MTESRQDSPKSQQASSSAMDPDEFAAQYRNAYPRLHLLAASIIGDRTYAHDIVQEAATIAWQKADSFYAGASYVAWLAEIVRRCSLNYTRKTRGRRTNATDPELLAQTKESNPGNDGPWPICNLTGELVEEQKDFDDRLISALSELKIEPRCCLLLRIVQGLSYAEISELLGIPEGTAMSHVHRCRRQLRKLLESRENTTNKAEGG